MASLDALLSIIPMILMLSILSQAAASLSEHGKDALERQQSFDKLVSAADYTVKQGAAVHAGGLRYPNWLDESVLGEGYAESLRQKEGLRELYVGLGEPQGDYETCIYRLVVAGPSKEMRKLYVCGG
ncbi:MAG: hypothetical protein AB1529_00295 [Candidatus Micrarchaeota archaeon]